MTGKLLDGVRGLVAGLRVIAGVLLIGSITLNFVNVVARYFFHASIHWAEEIMLYMMVGCVFLGNGVVAWSGRQLRMDVIVGMMPPKARDAFDLLAELALIGTFMFDQRSQSADVPMYIPQALVPLGLSIMALLVVIRLWTGGDPRESGKPGH